MTRQKPLEINTVVVDLFNEFARSLARPETLAAFDGTGGVHVVEVAEGAAHASETFSAVKKDAWLACVRTRRMQQTAKCQCLGRKRVLNEGVIDGVKSAPVEIIRQSKSLTAAFPDSHSQVDKFLKTVATRQYLPMRGDGREKTVDVASALVLNGALFCCS